MRSPSRSTVDVRIVVDVTVADLSAAGEVLVVGFDASAAVTLVVGVSALTGGVLVSTVVAFLDASLNCAAKVTRTSRITSTKDRQQS